ncbi:hypothetical protein HKBW3S03_01187 [Candidatus Hakubella thermalkaliphila]|uniref:Zinc-ribbon domain-containing protein n=1 Tax=Candidatus Hakubella thermalkaliphila TaxID=2754717 RepID=A0A6V8Q7I9_9ACTN|nr:zinc-ribbon domain-containing protein [Candidatus Hakubella thermalkaliphila]GFP19682.1 hypothetical protein HKBW3S03_01187 [Candidatus Hakubella thermalkaliphila]GFP23906.1 hypothetical protein HKBW3S09_01372 [Candidatus Hakubella thermalkaliphila]GFP30972.1 hypothetical protein HKBW3S34_01891 [Candidatus Hakubella thermalkaliphila]GFP40054.1 hypothetical protein HKBW3S47_01751 [Candidatus Hakubella thermalkaliphila]GFP43079.1 hypothetical protein HKBW3C_02211 [Candidatus Hakubella thermal
MFCFHCGQKVEPRDRFCNGCGTPVGAVARGKMGVSPHLVKSLAVLGGVLAVLLVLVIMVTGWRGPHSSPRAVVKAFVEAAEQGDAARIVRLMDPAFVKELLEERDMELEELISEMAEEYWPAEDAMSLEFIVGKERIFNGRAEVEVTMKFKYRDETEVNTAPIPVVKRNGKWYVVPEDLLQW